jgi:hypothetical protein
VRISKKPEILPILSRESRLKTAVSSQILSQTFPNLPKMQSQFEWLHFFIYLCGRIPINRQALAIIFNSNKQNYGEKLLLLPQIGVCAGDTGIAGWQFGGTCR